MTTNITTDGGGAGTPDESSHDDGADTVEEPGGEPSKGSNAEAARYRVQLREEQTQHEATRQLLATYQRAAAEAALAELLAQPADLFDVGKVDLADHIDDTGQVNAATLVAAAQELLKTRPGLKAEQTGLRDWGQNGEAPPGPVGWKSVIGNR